MNINDLLTNLGLDLTNPEVKRGAIEAIEAILGSRSTAGAEAEGGGSEEIEIDPELLQPSVKQPSSGSDDDIEVEDEEDVLKDVKFNDPEENVPNTPSGTETKDSTEGEQEIADAEDTAESGSSTSDDTGNDANSEETEKVLDTDETTDDETDDTSAMSDTDTDLSEIDDEIGEEDEAEDEEEFDFDEDDLLDDEIKDQYEDEKITSKHEARKLKRERTILAANKALADARARHASPALINELEKAIEALSALTEAANKSLKDISDAEFNLLVNRVLDAIDALGNSGLTYKSDEERALQAQEIKADLGNRQTQAELSAEDIAQIRAENQAIKARERENDKYKAKSRKSFKGFQEFLNSLYRAVALQVTTTEEQDDTWSAINRRYSGTGVLQQGKRINELPNKKIPVIDFYFDCSGSWGDDDIEIGKKAVAQLVEMEEKGQIKINIYYFSNNVYTEVESARNEGGTRAWNEIVKNVISTQATNVIIMTDSDMEDYWNGPTALSYTVPGYVWYLWRDGINAPRLPRDLKGRGGTQQFSFSHSDL